MKKKLFFIGMCLFCTLVITGSINSISLAAEKFLTRSTIYDGPSGKIIESTEISTKAISKDVTPIDKVSHFRQQSYKFSISPHYISSFDNEISLLSKQYLSDAHLRIEELTKNGTVFNMNNIQYRTKWDDFVTSLTDLHDSLSDESILQNDINNAGALMLQIELYEDEPSYKFLYELIDDLYKATNNEDVLFGVTMFVDNSDIVNNYVKSKTTK